MGKAVVAVTGVPCSGKTTLCRKLGSALGCRVLHLNELIEAECLYGEYDAGRDTKVVDVGKLKKRVHSLIDSDAILDGLLSHLLKPTHVVVLRCDPRMLVKRMKKRGYSRTKIMENVEAEYLGVILEESLRLCKNVLEVDNTSGADVDAIAGWVKRGGRKVSYTDWSSEFMEVLNG